MPSKDLDQSGHPPSLTSLHWAPDEGLGPELPIKPTERLWSDWAHAQADLSLHWWAHRSFYWFCHARLIRYKLCINLAFQIVNLKRFQFLNGRWVKSHKIVKFPLENFDPACYLAPRKQTVSQNVICTRNTNSDQSEGCGHGNTSLDSQSENCCHGNPRSPVPNAEGDNVSNACDKNNPGKVLLELISACLSLIEEICNLALKVECWAEWGFFHDPVLLWNTIFIKHSALTCNPTENFIS